VLWIVAKEGLPLWLGTWTVSQAVVVGMTIGGPILVPKTVLSAELMRIFANQRCLLAMDDQTSTF
jgi:hypothetical protein